MSGHTFWGFPAVACEVEGVVGALPIILFALLVQRHFVRGLTLGAEKSMRIGGARRYAVNSVPHF
jgi:hypothetical protein